MRPGRRGLGEEEQEAAGGGERRAHHAGRRGEPQPRQEAEGLEEAEGAGGGPLRWVVRSPLRASRHEWGCARGIAIGSALPALPSSWMPSCGCCQICRSSADAGCCGGRRVAGERRQEAAEEEGQERPQKRAYPQPNPLLAHAMLCNQQSCTRSPRSWHAEPPGDQVTPTRSSRATCWLTCILLLDRRRRRRSWVSRRRGGRR